MAPETLSLSGKAALITGSGRENGIGAAIARAFARNGTSVAIHYVSDDSKSRAEKVAADIARKFGTKTTVVRGAVQEHDAAHSMVEETLNGLNVDRIGILVNSSGAAVRKSPLEITPQDLEYEFGVNVFGNIYMIQAVVGVGRMPRGGRTINIGTVASKLAYPGTYVHCAAKAAQDSLTSGWAGELGKSHGITVNTLAPGPMHTDMSAPYLKLPDGSPSPIQTTMASQA